MSSARSSGCTSWDLSPKMRASRRTGDPYKEWMLADQQDIIAIRKVYEEIEGKLK